MSDGSLSAWDDYPVHQAPDVLTAVLPALPGWSERFYFNGLRPTGEIAFIAGGGVYPARGIAECYFCRLEGDRQVNVRAWQPAPARSEAVETEGFSLRCESPMRDWQVTIDLPEDQFSGRFGGLSSPFLYPTIDVPADQPGGSFDAFRHFVALGRWEIDHAPNMAATEGLLGVRDRTWGVRTRRPRLHSWSVLSLDDALLTLKHQERADGSVLFSHGGLTHADGRVEPLTVEEHDYEFDPHVREFVRGRLRFGSAAGELELELERVGSGMRLAGAGYDDSQGDRGSDRGVQRDEYDLGEPEVAVRTGRGTIDIGVRASLSGAWSAEGSGVFESAVARDHVRYGPQLSRG